MLKYVILTDYIQNFLAFQGAIFSSSKDKADSWPRQYFWAGVDSYIQREKWILQMPQYSAAFLISAFYSIHH